MRDFLPEQAEQRQWLADTLRGVYGRYGYRQIETPALEDLRWLESAQGGENEKLIFKVLRRGIDPTQVRDVAGLAGEGLRFDLTVPLARFFASNGTALPRPFRVFQLGPVWRAERPQRGRWRQFTQCDIDIVGEPSMLAEAELIAATCDGLAVVGLPEFRVRVNDRRLLTALLKACAFPTEATVPVLVTVDKLDKIGLSGVERSLIDGGHSVVAVKALLGVLEAAREAGDGDGLADALPMGIDTGALEGLAAITSAVAEQSDRRLEIVTDLSLVRGMGYYTGPIFEVDAPGLGASIGGGGRYDGMIGRFSGEQVPACGFSLGFERLCEVLPAQARRDGRGRVALLCRAEQSVAVVLADARRLRDAGYVVETVPLAGRAKGVYKRLAAAGFDQVVDAVTGDLPRPLHTEP